MITRCSILTMLVFLVSMPILAAGNMNDWNYSIPIQIEGDNKYKSIFLTEDVYEHAASRLKDLRIVDSQGNYVPFYINNGYSTIRPNKTVYTAKVVQTFKKENDSYIDFKIIPIKNNEDISGNSLVFELPESSFLKHLQIYGGYDGDKWDSLGDDYVFKEKDHQKNEVQLRERRKYTYYRIIILGDLENIDLNKMSLINNYREKQWSSYVRSSSVKFDMQTNKNESTITLYNDQRLLIKQIRLEVEDNFQRNYKIYDGNSSKNIIKKGELYNLQLENIKALENKIDFADNPISAPIITISIDNRDDLPLVIKSISIEYYVDKIVFLDNGNAPYELYFGNNKAEKPKYEVEMQKEYIEREQQDSCVLGSIQIKRKEEKIDQDSTQIKYIFNGVIILVSILLIGILVTRLNNKGT